MSKIKITTKRKLSTKIVKHESPYYDPRYLDSFNAQLLIILSERGLGKTFRHKFRFLTYCIKHNKKMVYVVDNDKQIEELSANKGEKFFGDIVEYLVKKSKTSNTAKKLLKYFDGNNELVEVVEVVEDTNDKETEIKKGLIIINGEQYGYIISINSFARLKRNSFSSDYCRLLIDEFIPETQDIRTLQNPYKVRSLIESICRTRKDVKAVMLANTIRKTDPILIRLKIDNIQPREIIKKYTDGKLFMVAYRIAKDDYPELEKMKNDSFSGKFGALLGETDLDYNEFIDELDSELLIPHSRQKSKLAYNIIGEEGSIRIHRVVGEYMYYVMNDYGNNSTRMFCINKNCIGLNVHYKPELKELFETVLANGAIRFSDAKAYKLFKSIMHIK